VSARDVPIAEALLLLWSIFLTPAILLLLFAAVTGRLAADEDRRYLPLLSPEPDVWDRSDDAEGPAPAEGGADRERA
jgi:hypothetical protein